MHKRGRGQEGQASEALQLILPLWHSGWEEQHQAASVLLWDVPLVQTNRLRASGLMGTRPAQGPLFLFPSSFSPPSLYGHRSTDTLQLKDALQLSQTDLKIFPSFPTQQQFMMFHAFTSALTFLTLEQPDSSDPHLSPQTHFLSLSHAFSVTPPLSHSLHLHLRMYHTRPHKAYHWPRSILMTFSLPVQSISLQLCNKL